MLHSVVVNRYTPGILRGWRPDLIGGVVFGSGALGWLLLYATLTLGRTTLTTLSVGWLITLAGMGLGLLAWYLLVYFLLRRVSAVHPSVALTRCLATTAPMLLSVPVLVAAYGSDIAFHYFFSNDIPRSLVLWTPPLLALLCLEALLIGTARIPSSWNAALLGSRAMPLLILAAFATLYISTAGGHIYSPDEVIMYSVTKNLVERGSVAIPSDSYAVANGAPAYSYSKYGLVPSLLAAPAYWLSARLGWNPDPQSPAFPLVNDVYPLVGLLVGPLVTAATCMLIYLLTKRLGFRTESSLAVALLYGLSTSAWVYSKTFFTQPSAALFLLATVYLLLRSHVPSKLEAGLAGACFGLALGSRVEVALLAAPVALLLLRSFKRDRFAAASATAAFLLCLGLSAGLVVGWYDWAKTGSIFMTGHGGQATLGAFEREPWLGVFGTFFSPGFSVLLFNPITLLGLLANILLVRRRALEGYIFGGMLLMSALFYGSFEDWFGGFTWADRYLVVMLPFAVIPVAALLERPRGGALSLLAVGLAALLGFAINSLGALFDFNNGWLDLWDHQANLDLIAWNPHFSPIVAHLRMLRDYFFTGAKLDLYLYYKFGFPALLTSLILFTGCLTLAIRAALGAKDERLGAVTAAD